MIKTSYKWAIIYLISLQLQVLFFYCLNMIINFIEMPLFIILMCLYPTWSDFLQIKIASLKNYSPYWMPKLIATVIFLIWVSIRWLCLSNSYLRTTEHLVAVTLIGLHCAISIFFTAVLLRMKKSKKSVSME